MRRRKSIWEDHIPGTLKQICIKSCIENSDEFKKQLSQDICLPSQVSEDIIAYVNDYEHKQICPEIMEIFCDYSDKLPLKNLILYNTEIPASLIRRHKFSRLELHGVDVNLEDGKEFKNVNYESENIEVLHLDLTSDDMDLDKFHPAYHRKKVWSDEREFIQILTCDLKNAKHIACKQYEMDGQDGLIDAQSAINLTVLGTQDEYSWQCNPNLLTSLILSQGELVKENFKQITQLINLQLLDVSFSDTEYLDAPEDCLRELVEKLVNLKSLDISGTDLIRNPTKDTGCDVEGLESRVQTPLEYIGVYHEDIMCPRVPAKVVAATDTVDRILTTAEHHMDKAFILRRILAKYLEFFGRSDSKIDIERGLDTVVQCLEYHLFKDEFGVNETLPISGAACIYDLISLCGEHRRFVDHQELVKKMTLADINLTVKKRILWVLIRVLRLAISSRNEFWSVTGGQGSRAVLNNCLLALWQFNVPEDTAILYREVVEVLIGVVNSREDYHLQKLCILMLNSMVCFAEGDKKKILGVEIVETVVKSIERQIKTTEFSDQLLECSWTTLWNVTDETPEHSMRFIQLNGLKLFLKCKDKFPSSLNLLKNMMGLLGNIAENKSCRKYMMENSDIVKEFSLLLDSQSDGIEVSYNAAGVVSHIGYDGPDAWTLEDPDRQFVLDKMVTAIHRWPVDSDRSINYRSLVPILILLECAVCPEAQLWAAWAIANLTTYDPPRFARLTVEEGGDKIIKQLNLECYRADLRDKMTELKQIIIQNTEQYKNI